MKKFFGPGGKLDLTFGEFEYRQGQGEMAGAVVDVLKTGGELIVEAGPGTGKTLAYLIPAHLSGLKVIISTGALNLQEQIVTKDIPQIEKLFPGELVTACMKGRGNYLCKRRLKNFRQLSLIKGAEEKLFSKLLDWAGSTETGDRAEISFLPDDYRSWSEINSQSELCLGQACPTFDTCFITKMRAKAAKADIVVVNHHLFFADLNVRDSLFGEVIPDHDAVIFDEAHKVEQVATNYFGQYISNWRVADIVRDTGRELELAKINNKDTSSNLMALERRAKTFFDSFTTGVNTKRKLTGSDVNRVAELANDLLNSMTLLGASLDSIQNAPETIKTLANRFAELCALLREILSMEKDDYVYCVRTKDKGVFLESFPIDISDHLKEKLYPRQSAVVFTSASLATGGNFDFIKSRLGLDSPAELIIESPFDYKLQSVFYVAADLPDPSSHLFVGKAAERIKTILTKTGGRAFVLFTSYKNMGRVYSLLDGKIPYTVFRQGTGPRSVIIDQFRKETSSVLFATSSFWEGVDVQGKSLSAVIIDRLPFAAPDDPQVSARIETIEKRGGSAFREYQLPSAALALKQGLGRLIRSKKDTGLLATLDRRIVTKNYGKTFLKSLPEFTIRTTLDDLDKDLAEMWSSQPDGA